jgi:hypothetical protein
MELPNRRRNSVTALLVGLLLLIGLAVIVAGFAPIAICPCTMAPLSRDPTPCVLCGDRGFTTFFKKWLKGSDGRH